MNKRGGMTDIFILMIMAFAIVLICVIFIYIGGRANTEIHAQIDGMMFGEANGTEIVDNSIGVVNETYQALYWISWFLIVGMIISIFIGSFLVTTKPVFFIPYIFITIIAVIVSVGISNGYEMVRDDPTLASTFTGMWGANFIMAQLPIWITIVSIVGGIIMFARMGSRENQIYGSYG